jgi:hypothetical protein
MENHKPNPDDYIEDEDEIPTDDQGPQVKQPWQNYQETSDGYHEELLGEGDVHTEDQFTSDDEDDL